MSFHSAFNGSPTDPDTFATRYEGRSRFPRADNQHFRARNFSPSARKSGEDILRDLKGRLRSGDKMFFNDCFFTPDAMFAKADEGEDVGGGSTLRGRPPHLQQGFNVPSWAADDHDMSDLAARMSHAPHFATMGRRSGPSGVGGVPWRERRHSGGSAMSVTSEDDSIDPSTDKASQSSGGSEQTVPHEIPIRFEAPPPHPQHPQGSPQHPQGLPQHLTAPQEGETGARLSQCPLRTTSAVDATGNMELGNGANRNSRCASAPPEMAEMQQQQEQQQQEPPTQQQQQQPQRFVSKINITPQAPPSPQMKASPPFSTLPAKFNTVPRPFVPGEQQYPQQTQQYPQQTQQYPQQTQQYPQQTQQYPQQYQQYQQPPLGFYPPPDPQWQFQQQQYPPQQPQQEPQPQPQQRAGSGGGGQRPSVVRNIPIFVEGRDDPVDQNDSKPSQQWTQTRQQPQQPPPQPVPQPPPPPQPKKQNKRQQVHQPTPPPTQPIPHAVPMPMPDHVATPPPQYQNPPQEETAPQQPIPPPPPQPPRDPRMKAIEKVRATVSELSEKVTGFQGAKNDREFLYLDEMLTRALLQLDNVDPDGCDEVRQARRGVIKDINAAISNLESLAKDPVTPKDSTVPDATEQDPLETPQQESTENGVKEEQSQEMEMGNMNEEKKLDEGSDDNKNVDAITNVSSS